MQSIAQKEWNFAFYCAIGNNIKPNNKMYLRKAVCFPINSFRAIDAQRSNQVKLPGLLRNFSNQPLTTHKKLK
jgi:hypothetical protein